MPENYDKYKTFTRHDTNRKIDHVVIMHKGYTKSEIVAGFLIFAPGIYTMTIKWWLMPLILPFCLIVPFVMKWVRENFPRNAVIHKLWYLGQYKQTEKQIKRPQKTFLAR